MPKCSTRRFSDRWRRYETFTSEDEVIARANDTEYGLVAYLYTKELSRGLRVSEKLDYGMIGLNRGLVSDPPRLLEAPSSPASAAKAPMRG